MDDSKPRRQRKPRQTFYDPDGNKLTMGVIKKYWRDIYADHLGFKTDDNGIDKATVVDLENPLGEYQLQPGPLSPICAKCGLNECGGRNLYMPYGGADKPEVTIIVDAVSKKEDVLGEIGSEGQSAFIKDIIEEHGYPLEKIRWAPMTICPPENPREVNFKTKARWCRNFLVQDLLENTPKLIIPVGSTSLGWLSHKSNAQDWGGRLLTYRGWPDDWLSTPEFMLPRQSPYKGETLTGHPLFGPAPNMRIPMIPLQSPRIVWMTQNRHLITQWKNQLKWALDMAGKHIPAPVYDKPWWSVTTHPDDVVAAMEEILETPGQVVAFDVETNGFKAWGEGAKLVIMMFRYKAPDGSPRAIGFPWDYPESPLVNHIQALSPIILEAMYKSKLCGHNVSFDVGWVAANVPGADLNKLNDAMWYDTWHMAYVRRQGKGTLGLEMMAYEYVQDLAGYEEDMVMLIDLLEDDLHPGAGKGGHYAKCPEDKWDSHLKPYIMGDVEVCYGAHEAITEELAGARQYSIPLAHQTRRGSFRWFKAPKRDWVYNEIVSPAAAMLSKMMCRGMHVNLDELDRQEDLFPKKIRETINALRESHPRIMDWCAQMEATDQAWEFDLEKKDKVLKPLLFEVLGLPVHRLTDSGKKKFGDKPEDMESLSRELLIKYAATDKFSLNKLAVDHEEIRPLLEYRKIHKQYGTYVRSMRNLYTPGLDKEERTKDPHLNRDGHVHATFKLTGTRGGRLSCSDPNLQQLPRDGLIKRLYDSRYGKRGVLYQADLSQIELRLMAAACGDRAMVQAYLDDVDLHSLTQSKITDRTYEECCKEHLEWLQKNGREDEAKKIELERKIAKTVNFLTGYGGGAFGLQTSLAQQGIYKQIEECEEVLESFFDGYPSLRKYLSHYKAFIQDTGVAVSILGRVRIFEEVFGDNNEAKNKALRAGCNHLIQSTASDMMLLALTTIENVMRAEGLESQLISTVHDSALIDVVREELPVVHEIVIEVLDNLPTVMKAAYGEDYDTSWMIVPISGDAEIGPNYLDMLKLPSYGEIDFDEYFHKIDAAA